MASLPFPDSGSRYVELPNGRPATGQVGYLYQDAALTVVAEAYADVAGVKGALLPTDSAGRRYLSTDSYGRQVDYWGPADETDRLWLVVNGVANPVDADYNARLDALGTRVVELESASASGATVLHKSGAETVTGVKTFTVSPVVPSPSGSTDVAPKGYVDTAQADAIAAAATDAANRVATEATSRAAADALLATAVNATDPTYGLSTSASAAANTTALTAALAAAVTAGKPVYVPPGTYNHNGLTITTAIVGSASLSRSILHGPQITLSSNAVQLVDLKLVSSSATAVISAHCTDVKWIRVEVSHDVSVTTDHLAWNAFDVDRMRVLDCKFGIGGLQLSGCDDFVIHGNFWDAQYANTNEPCHISGQSSGIFTANTVTNTLTDAVDLFSAGHRCVISNNRFIGLRGAAGLECKVTMSDDPGNTSSPGNVFESTVITGNVFRDFNSSVTSTRAGIFASYVDNRAVPGFVVAETNRGIVITGNIMADFNASDPGNGAIVSYQGIVYHGHNGLVTNNLLRNMRAWNAASPVGVALFCETADVAAGRTVYGAAVRGNHFAGIEGGAGIRCGNVTNGSISDNTVRGDEVNATNTKFGIDVVAGATLTNVVMNNNQFNCSGYSTGMGVRSTSTGATLARCTMNGNIFKNCGVALAATQHSTFVGNMLDNATNHQSFSVGVSGTSSRGNTFTGNHITMGADYGLLLTDCDGFTVVANTFFNTNYAIILVGNTRHGSINNNISITQSGSSTTTTRFSGVSANDTATTSVGTGNYVLNGSTLVNAQVTSVVGSNAWLVAGVPALTYTSVTRNSNGAPTTATVVWPDGVGGTHTSDTLSTAFPGAVDAYHVTYLGSTTRTVTQAAVTRDSTSGLITAQPALVVS